MGFLDVAKEIIEKGSNIFRNVTEDTLSTYGKTISQLKDIYTDEKILNSQRLIRSGKLSAMAEYRQFHNIGKQQLNEELLNLDLSDIDKKSILAKFNETEKVAKQSAKELDRSGILKDGYKLSDSDSYYRVRDRLIGYKDKMDAFKKGDSIYSEEVRTLKEAKVERQGLLKESEELEKEVKKALGQESPIHSVEDDIVDPNADLKKEIARKKAIISSPKDDEGRIMTKERLRESHEWTDMNGNTYYKNTKQPIYKETASNILDSEGKPIMDIEKDAEGNPIITGYKDLKNPEYHKKYIDEDGDEFDDIIGVNEYNRAFKETEDNLFSNADLGIASNVINNSDTSGMGFLTWAKEHPIPTAIGGVVGLKVFDRIFDNDEG